MQGRMWTQDQHDIIADNLSTLQLLIHPIIPISRHSQNPPPPSATICSPPLAISSSLVPPLPPSCCTNRAPSQSIPSSARSPLQPALPDRPAAHRPSPPLPSSSSSSSTEEKWIASLEFSRKWPTSAPTHPHPSPSFHIGNTACSDQSGPTDQRRDRRLGA